MKFGIRPCIWHRSRRICHLHSLSKFETLEVRAYGTFSTFARPAPFRWRVGNNFQTTTSAGKEWGRFWWDDLTVSENRDIQDQHIGFDSLKWTTTNLAILPSHPLKLLKWTKKMSHSHPQVTAFVTGRVDLRFHDANAICWYICWSPKARMEGSWEASDGSGWWWPAECCNVWKL